MRLTVEPRTRFNRAYTIEAPEGDIKVHGSWHSPEPDLGILGWAFEISDATNELGVRVDPLLDDEDWVLLTQEHISKAYAPYGD